MHKVVISDIQGGLGNQMFMYAIARAISLRIGAKLYLSYNKTDIPDQFGRLFELDRFNIAGEPNRFADFNYPWARAIRFVSHRLGCHLPFPQVKFIGESNFHFDESLLSKDLRGCHLHGYWQSEEYFADCKDQIREDFSFKIRFSDDVEQERALIESYGDRAVALCVRRYQEVKKFINLKLTKEDYYLKAIELAKTKVENPVFFCFSQVPEWVKENLEKACGEVIYINPKTGKDSSHEDIYLLQQFKNFIISNSSFYWWGAWLSKKGNKMVISPDNWCCNKSNCSDWIVLK